MVVTHLMEVALFQERILLRSIVVQLTWLGIQQKNIVAADLAERCEVQLSYGIGVAEPTSFYVKTQGTGGRDDNQLTKLARDVFPIKPGEIVAHLDLKKPRYRQTAAYGHFGRELDQFTWEKTDMVDTLLNKLQDKKCQIHF